MCSRGTIASFSAAMSTLGERQGDHSAVRRADDGAQALNADLIERRGNRLCLVVRAHDALGTPVEPAPAVDEVAADKLVACGVERPPPAGDTLPPSRAGV